LLRDGWPVYIEIVQRAPLLPQNARAFGATAFVIVQVLNFQP
jgi:hypothetical protein